MVRINLENIMTKYMDYMVLNATRYTPYFTGLLNSITVDKYVFFEEKFDKSLQVTYCNNHINVYIYVCVYTYT